MRRLDYVVAAMAALATVVIAGWSQDQIAQFPPPSKIEVPSIYFESPEGFVPQDWTLRPRPPIKFTPFEMVDPATGKPVKADDIIEVNGVKMRAGDFYRQLNAMEQWLNEHGYSLRTDKVFEYYSPTLEAEIAQSEEYVRWLAENAPLDGDLYGEGSDFSMASCYDYSNSWNSNWMGNSVFGMQVGGSVSAQACLTSRPSATVTGRAVIRGQLGGYQRDIANAQGSVSASQSSNSWSYQLAIQVLGRTVWNDSRSGQLPGYQRSFNLSVAQLNWSSPSIRLFCASLLGVPICVSGRVGISGRMNLEASVNITSSQQSAQVGPRGSLTGYASAWVEGGVSSLASVAAGVRGNLTFLQGGVTEYVTGLLMSGPRYRLTAGLSANLTALSGNLQGFVRGCLGSRCAEANYTLFSWNGWSYNSNLVSWSRTLP